MAKDYKTDLIHSNASKGVVLGKASSDGLGLYEPGLAPVVGVNLSEVKPHGILTDRSYDEIQSMANAPNPNGAMVSGAAAIKGLIGDGSHDELPLLPPPWHPETTALTRFLLPYAASLWDSTPISEVLAQNSGKVVNRKPKVVGNYSQGE